jgi:hypothetical protein
MPGMFRLSFETSDENSSEGISFTMQELTCFGRERSASLLDRWAPILIDATIWKWVHEGKALVLVVVEIA